MKPKTEEMKTPNALCCVEVKRSKSCRYSLNLFSALNSIGIIILLFKLIVLSIVPVFSLSYHISTDKSVTNCRVMTAAGDFCHTFVCIRGVYYKIIYRFSNSMVNQKQAEAEVSGLIA